jgi:hypothetical protein
MEMYNKEDLIYFAGLFDGEGTITLTKKCSKENRIPEISIPSTTYELLEFCKSTFGGNIKAKKTYKNHHKKILVLA